jgi:hypothetical protein
LRPTLARRKCACYNPRHNFTGVVTTETRKLILHWGSPFAALPVIFETALHFSTDGREHGYFSRFEFIRAPFRQWKEFWVVVQSRIARLDSTL